VNTERKRAAALQASLGVGVQASGKGYAIVDYDALERLRERVEEYGKLAAARQAEIIWLRESGAWVRDELQRLAAWAGEQNEGNAFATQVAQWALAHLSDLDLPVNEREP
jgi:hypothetical protein